MPSECNVILTKKALKEIDWKKHPIFDNPMTNRSIIKRTRSAKLFG